jgi:hypothetical protein
MAEADDAKNGRGAFGNASGVAFSCARITGSYTADWRDGCKGGC